MSESPAEQTFQDEVAKMASGVVEEWTGQGWTVVELTSAQADWLPEPLRRLKPDFVLRKDDEIIVVEAKAWKPGSMEDLDVLARAVAEVPNARLDLHWVGAADAAISEAMRKSVSKRSDEARELLASGHLEAAALIAWSAFEGALLRYAAKLLVPLPSVANGATLPWQLLSELDSLGYVNERDLRQLTEFRRQRNAAAHFMEPEDPPSRTDIEHCLGVADRMLTGRYVSVDQMIDWWGSHPRRPPTRLNEARENARSLLERNFPGAEAADILEAVMQVYPHGEW